MHPLRLLARVLSARENESLRFAASEALLLDALVEQPDGTQGDAAFRTLRQRLHDFSAPTALAPPTSFVGELRDYQRLGLGWFDRLRELRMGGYLADEMGLGKTVQVLAMLAAQHACPPIPATRRTAGARTNSESTPPSLLVVPRYLVQSCATGLTKRAVLSRN